MMIRPVNDAAHTNAAHTNAAHEANAESAPPTLPDTPGWEVAARLRPAQATCGDFYDAFRLAGERIALVVGDVCDVGPATTSVAAMLQELVRAAMQEVMPVEVRVNGTAAVAEARAEESGAEVERLQAAAGAINRQMYARHAQNHLFATLFLGILDSGAGELYYVNAGQEAPVILLPGGRTERLAHSGPAIGLLDEARFVVHRAQIRPGNTLLVYTDGVTDARNEVGSALTLPRLLTLVNGASRSSEELLDAIERLAAEHAGGAEPYDDITMLAVRRTPDRPA